MAADPSQGPVLAGIPVSGDSAAGNGPSMPGGEPPVPPGPPPADVAAQMQHEAPVPPTPGPDLGTMVETLTQACITTASAAMAASNPPDAKDFATAAMNLAQGISAVNPPQKPIDPNLHAQKPPDPMAVASLVADAHKQAADHAQEIRSQAHQHAHELAQMREQHQQRLEQLAAQPSPADQSPG